MRFVVFEVLVANGAPSVLWNRRLYRSLWIFSQLHFQLPFEIILKFLVAFCYYSVVFGRMKNTLSCRKQVQALELRYFYFQSRIKTVAEAENEHSLVVLTVRVIKMQLFGNLLNAENRISRHLLPDVLVVGELEFLFQVVSRLEKLQIEVGHLLVQGLKELDWQHRTIFIQQNKSHPLHSEEKRWLRES